MITFEKSKRYLFYYVGVLLVTITLFISWVVMIVKNPGSTSGDIVLLSFLFLILFGGEALFLIIYLLSLIHIYHYINYEYQVLKQMKLMTISFV